MIQKEIASSPSSESLAKDDTPLLSNDTSIDDAPSLRFHDTESRNDSEIWCYSLQSIGSENRSVAVDADGDEGSHHTTESVRKIMDNFLTSTQAVNGGPLKISFSNSSQPSATACGTNNTPMNIRCGENSPCINWHEFQMEKMLPSCQGGVLPLTNTDSRNDSKFSENDQGNCEEESSEDTAGISNMVLERVSKDLLGFDIFEPANLLVDKFSGIILKDDKAFGRGEDIIQDRAEDFNPERSYPLRSKERLRHRKGMVAERKSSPANFIGKGKATPLDSDGAVIPLEIIVPIRKTFTSNMTGTVIGKSDSTNMGGTPDSPLVVFGNNDFRDTSDGVASTPTVTSTEKNGAKHQQFEQLWREGREIEATKQVGKGRHETSNETKEGWSVVGSHHTRESTTSRSKRSLAPPYSGTVEGYTYARVVSRNSSTPASDGRTRDPSALALDLITRDPGAPATDRVTRDPGGLTLSRLKRGPSAPTPDRLSEDPSAPVPRRLTKDPTAQAPDRLKMNSSMLEPQRAIRDSCSSASHRLVKDPCATCSNRLSRELRAPTQGRLTRDRGALVSRRQKLSSKIRLWPSFFRRKGSKKAFEALNDSSSIISVDSSHASGKLSNGKAEF